MGYVSNAMIELAEAGAVMIEMTEVREWRAAGHDVPVRFVDVDTYRGRRPMPALDVAVAERLAGSLEDEQARETLRQAVEDVRDYRRATGRDPQTGECLVTRGMRRAAASARITAARLAVEIVDAVRHGRELPEEWHKYDTYADVGEPLACEVVRLVREELLATGVRA